MPGAGRWSRPRGLAGHACWSASRSCSTWPPCSPVRWACRRPRTLERAIADRFTPYFDLMDLGYSYRFYAEPPPTPVVTATIQFGDGRPEETVRLPGREVPGPRMRHQRQLALANALYADVQEARQRAGDAQPEPVGTCLCPASLPDPARLPERDPARPAAPDPRPGPGARGDRGARRAAVRSVRRVGCSPRPNGSETSRATTSERGPGLSRRAGGCHPPGMGRLLLHAGRPDGPGADPRGRGLLAFWSLLVFGLDLHDYFGSDGWAEPSAIRASQRSLAWSFWFLVPDGGLRLAWLRLPGGPGALHVGLFSRWTAVLAWVIVVSTVRRVPVALYGFDQVLSPLTLYLAATGASGQAVSLDRFFRRWRQARAAARPAPARRAGGRARAAGLARRAGRSRRRRCRPIWPCG